MDKKIDDSTQSVCYEKSEEKKDLGLGIYEMLFCPGSNGRGKLRFAANGLHPKSLCHMADSTTHILLYLLFPMTIIYY